jgi:hypothetical protein
VEKNETKLPELRPEDLPLQEIEKRTLMFPKILELAVKNTQPSDWVDFGGTPWLDTPGAERIARVFGFTVKDTRFEKLDRQDRDGPYYIYIWYGKVGLAKADLWIDAIGTCSSRKPFHAMEHGVRKHIEDINEMNILKDAYSNLIENGVSRFLGLRGLDWETLEKAGIQRSKVSKVEFKAKKEERSPAPAPQSEKASPSPQQEPPKETKDILPPQRRGEGKGVDPKTRGSLIDYAVNRVVAGRDVIDKLIEPTFTMRQCNYILQSLAKLQGDVKLEEFEGIVRGAIARGGD